MLTSCARSPIRIYRKISNQLACVIGVAACSAHAIPLRFDIKIINLQTSTSCARPLARSFIPFRSFVRSFAGCLVGSLASTTAHSFNFEPQEHTWSGGKYLCVWCIVRLLCVYACMCSCVVSVKYQCSNIKYSTSQFVCIIHFLTPNPGRHHEYK